MGDPVREGFDLHWKRGEEVKPDREVLEEVDGGGVGSTSGGSDSIPQEASNLWRNVDVGIEG
jgi:hypothetical protein